MEYSSSSVFRAMRDLANFRALKLVRRINLVLFSCFTLYSLLSHHPIYSFYFVIINLLLPLALTSLLRTKKAKAAPEGCAQIFPILSEKYHFSREAHIAEQIVFYFVMILLILWQKNMNSSPLVEGFYSILPYFSLLTSLILYFSLRLFFQFHLKKQLRDGAL